MNDEPAKIPDSQAEPPPPVQLALPGAEEIFAEAGLETLPVGASELNSRQLRYAIAFVQTGNKAEAARRAGFSEDHARNLQKNAVLMRFMNASARIVSKNVDRFLRSQWEIYQSYKTELENLTAVPLENRTEKSLRREAQITPWVLRAGAIYGLLLKGSQVHVSGDVNLNSNAGSSADFIVLPPDALPGMAAARQEVAATNRLTQGRN